jgi:hypothetical protein
VKAPDFFYDLFTVTPKVNLATNLAKRGSLKKGLEAGSFNQKQTCILSKKRTEAVFERKKKK